MKKFIKYLIYLTAIIIYLIIIIIFFVYFIDYMKNIDFPYSVKDIIIGILGVGIVGAYAYYYLMTQHKNTQLIEKIFKIDIANDKGKHIRLTDNNILFKYYVKLNYLNNIIKKYGPRVPEYIVKHKMQLNEKEVLYIIEEIEKLDNIQNGLIKINYEGNIKYVNSDDINRILANFDITL